MIIGVDEAGRGSVVGPMVICAFICEEDNLEKLEDLGVTDSKLLNSSKRKKIKQKLDEYDYKNYIVKPKEIDSTSLGKLFRDVIFNAITTHEPDKIIIDSPVPANNLEDYRDKILGRSPIDLEVVCENEADLKYPVVSASSIVAKQERDQRIDKINNKYRKVFSGYPDPRTIEFLENFYKKHNIFPPEVREKWETVAKIREKVDQLKLFEN